MTEIVATPLNIRLRKLWFQIHKWIALALMILLIPLGLSGIVLAWDGEIDHALNPQRYAVSGKATLAPATYVAAASAVLKPGQHVTALRFGDEGPVVATASGGGRRGGGRFNVWLDPPTARVLDSGRADAGLVALAHNFHGSLFVPGVGRALVGLLGTAMFVMAASGIWLWWPPMGRWTRGFRWQRGDRKLDTNLHHTIGFWIALPLAAQAFTGVWIASPQLVQLFTGAIGPTSAMGGAMRGGAPLETPRLTPDLALAMAQGQSGGAPLAINWPGAKDGLWRVALRRDKAKGPANLTVDDADGTVAAAPARDAGLAMTVRRYHDGTMLGFYWRMVMVLIGLSPTVLGVTGLLMWLRGRRWRNRPAEVRREREGVAV